MCLWARMESESNMHRNLKGRSLKAAATRLESASMWRSYLSVTPFEISPLRNAFGNHKLTVFQDRALCMREKENCFRGEDYVANRAGLAISVPSDHGVETKLVSICFGNVGRSIPHPRTTKRQWRGSLNGFRGCEVSTQWHSLVTNLQFCFGWTITVS